MRILRKNAGEAARGRLFSGNSDHGELLLLCGALHRGRRLRGGGQRGGLGYRGVLLGKIVVVPEILVELAGELGGAGTEGRPAAFQEEDRDQAALGRVGLGGEPAEAGSVVGACSGLAKDRQFAEGGAKAARGSVLDRAGHAVLQIGNVLGDVEGPLDLGRQVGGLV